MLLRVNFLPISPNKQKNFTLAVRWHEGLFREPDWTSVSLVHDRTEVSGKIQMIASSQCAEEAAQAAVH